MLRQPEELFGIAVVMRILIILSVFFSSLVKADCYLEITQNGSRSTRVFNLAPDEVDEYEVLNEEKALHVLSILIKRETSCKVEDILKGEKPASCYHLRTGVTCEVLTTIGYFIIHRSSYGVFDHSIIYTRWD
jgi:hypothetical protein